LADNGWQTRFPSPSAARRRYYRLFSAITAAGYGWPIAVAFSRSSLD